MPKISGECLYRFISYNCSEEPIVAGLCQCTDCQKVSGAGNIADIAAPHGIQSSAVILRFMRSRRIVEIQ
ncbi:GFA family protein [Microbulbifer sp. DLAB2-AF]|uniref:GFA family protein n=1 Tax=Microbulbifer sp. DLAB2-AF TaxID=3243395 RepID=UPI0040390C15